jgi:hypothetical protein
MTRFKFDLVDIIDVNQDMLSADSPANRLWQVLREGGDGLDRNDARELGQMLLDWANR